MKSSIYYPSMPVAHTILHLSRFVCGLITDIFLVWQLVDRTLELLLVFRPDLVWFFDSYQNFFLLSLITSANTPFTWLPLEEEFIRLTSCRHHIPLHLLLLEKWSSCLFLISTAKCIFRYPFLMCYFIPCPFSTVSYLNLDWLI